MKGSSDQPWRRSAAARARRRRHRQRHGLRVVPVTVPEWAVVSALLDRGLITEADSRDVRLVGEAIARIVTRWATPS